MYHIFFQPNDTVNVLKKHSTKEFSLLLFVASVLTALAVTLLFRMMPDAMRNAMPFFAQVNLIQFFLVVIVAVFVGSLIRALILHFVMKMFAEKGTFNDAFRIVTALAYLTSVYFLIILIIGSVPFVGMPLVAVASFFTFVILIAITLRGIVALYKVDLLTTIVALGILVIACMIAIHMAFFGMMASGKWQPRSNGQLPGMSQQGVYGKGMMNGWQNMMNNWQY